ncbi:MAG: right-handed parallel beta-helix repeat-containing protein [Victivallales bacterium]|nr:right-handed parallel beta-helix repeat-containing protein [Victivallales bacterium]
MSLFHVDNQVSALPRKGDGSEKNPFATISESVAVARAGDEIIIHAGTYRERVVLAHSGESEARRITFKAADGDKPVIKGSDIVSGWTNIEGCIWKCAQSYPEVQEPCSAYRPWKGSGYKTFPAFIFRLEQLFLDGEIVRHVPSLDSLVAGSFCVHGEGRDIYLMTDSRSLDPNGHLTEISVRPNVFDGASQAYIAVQGLTFMHSANYAQHGMLTTGKPSAADPEAKKRERENIRGWLIEDCELCWGNGSGVGFNGADHVLRRNVVHHMGQLGYGAAFIDNVIFEDNEGNWNNCKGYPQLWEAGGLKFCYARNTVIRRHKAFYNYGPGIWYDIDVADCSIEDCECGFNWHSGIMIEISERLKVLRNLCYHNRFDTWCGSGILVQLCADSEIAGNVCVGNEQYGIYMRWHPRQRGSLRRDNEPEQYFMDRNHIHHNIMCNNGYLEYHLDYQPQYAHANESDHNLFFSSRDKHIFPGFHSLDDWQHQFGLDMNSEFGDPGFCNEDLRDYRLRDGGMGKRLLAKISP